MVGNSQPAPVLGPRHALPSEILFFITDTTAENPKYETVHCTKEERDGIAHQRTAQEGWVLVGEISMQNGPMKEVGGANGIQIEHVLEAMADRIDLLAAYGHPTCRENSLTKTHIQDAVHWQWRRTHDRTARKVEGTSAS